MTYFKSLYLLLRTSSKNYSLERLLGLIILLSRKRNPNIIRFFFINNIFILKRLLSFFKFESKPFGLLSNLKFYSSRVAFQNKELVRALENLIFMYLMS